MLHRRCRYRGVWAHVWRIKWWWWWWQQVRQAFPIPHSESQFHIESHSSSRNSPDSKLPTVRKLGGDRFMSNVLTGAWSRATAAPDHHEKKLSLFWEEGDFQGSQCIHQCLRGLPLDRGFWILSRNSSCLIFTFRPSFPTYFFQSNLQGS